MGAVHEAAARGESVDIGEGHSGLLAPSPRRELAHARRVDDERATWQGEQFAMRRDVSAALIMLAHGVEAFAADSAERQDGHAGSARAGRHQRDFSVIAEVHPREQHEGHGAARRDDGEIALEAPRIEVSPVLVGAARLALPIPPRLWPESVRRPRA